MVQRDDRPVRLVFFTQTLGCEPCEQTKRILDELPPLSDRIAVDEVNFVLERDKAAEFGVDRVPAIALLGQNVGGRAQTRIPASGFSEHPLATSSCR